MPSEYIKYQLRNNKPKEAPPEYTKKEKLQNWLYYHKWYLIGAAVLIGILLDIGIHILNNRRNAPDYQIAYIGTAALPDDTVNALTEVFSSLGEDMTGDGTVRAVLHPYVLHSTSPGADAELAEFTAAAEIQLIGDMENCESYFFLVEDPQTVQNNFQILALKDGSSPETDDGADLTEPEYFAVPLSDLPVFSEIMDSPYTYEAAEQTVSGTARDYLDSLYLARRAFPEERECDYREACDILWEKLTD